MSGLSPISPAAAQSNLMTLPGSTQAQAQSGIQQGIQGLQGYQQYRPWQANQLTQQQVFNPYAAQGMAGAQQAAQFGGQAAQNQFGLGGNLEQLGQQVSESGQPLLQGANQVMNTAFDPQSALYQRTLQQQQQQMQAMNAQSGLGGSPYAAGLNAQNLQNFNISWQAQQLQNQIGGLNAASGAYGQYGALAQAGAGISGQGAGLQAGAPGLAAQSALLPYQTSEMMAQQGMGALAQLQQYGVGGTQIPQLGVSDWSNLLGLGSQLQQTNINSALAQSQIQQAFAKEIGGGIGTLGSLGIGAMGAPGFGGLGSLGSMGATNFMNTVDPFGSSEADWQYYANARL